MALRPPVEQELTWFKRDFFWTGGLLFLVPYRTECFVVPARWKVLSITMKGMRQLRDFWARLSLNKTKEPNGPITPAHIENRIALVTAAHHRSWDRKIRQTRISHGKSKWWHRKTSHGKSRWWHTKTSHGKSRWWHRKTSHGKSRWWKTSHGKSRWCASKEKQKKRKK